MFLNVFPSALFRPTTSRILPENAKCHSKYIYFIQTWSGADKYTYTREIHMETQSSVEFFLRSAARGKIEMEKSNIVCHLTFAIHIAELVLISHSVGFSLESDKYSLPQHSWSNNGGEVWVSGELFASVQPIKQFNINQVKIINFEI